MARRVWIIQKKEQVEQSGIDAATANNCPEIANGIPPALAGIITEAMLPCAYEEPEHLHEPKPRDLLVEMDEFKARVEKLEKLEKK